MIRFKYNTDPFLCIECPGSSAIQSELSKINATSHILRCTPKENNTQPIQWEMCDGNVITALNYPELRIINQTAISVNPKMLHEKQCYQCRLCKTAKYQFTVEPPLRKATLCD